MRPQFKRSAIAVRHLAHTGASAFRSESMRDVDDRLAQIGLTPKTGWYVGIALYAAGGVPAVLAHVLAPEQYNTGFLVLGALALVASLLSVMGLKFFPESLRATHARLSFGAALLLTGSVVVGDAGQAFILLGLVVSVPPAIYYGLRPAAVYAAGTVMFGLFTALRIEQPWAPGLAIAVGVALAAINGSMMFTQARVRRYARRNRELAYTDAQTGLANTRALHRAIDAELRDPNTLRAALFAIDLDNFKEVNDRFSHARGDEVLQAVAEALVACGEPGDIFARRGGDEFSLLVRDPGDRDLGELARCLASAIKAARERVCPEVTPSGSVAYVYARPGDSVGSLLQRADDALHEAKAEFHSADATNRPVRLAIIDRRSESDRASREKLGDVSRPDRRAGDVEPRERRGVARLRGVLAKDRPLWLYAAGTNAVLAAALAAAGIGGYTGELGVGESAAIASVLALLAGGCLLAAGWPLAPAGIHLAFIPAVALPALALALAGHAGAALLDLLAVPAVVAFHVFAPATAVRYLVACVAVASAFALGGHYPYGGAHAAVFLAMTVASATMTAKVRQVTARFIDENWRLSQLDALTGVSNVRALRARVSEAVEAAGQGARPALIAIDLDEFKQVNDSFSHSIGDRVLAAVARAIVENVRVDDLVARRGGDEFVVLAEGDREELERVAERVGEAIVRARRRICPQLLPTASVAVVQWEQGDDADAFMHRADVALHERKLEAHRRHRRDAS